MATDLSRAIEDWARRVHDQAVVEMATLMRGEAPIGSAETDRTRGELRRSIRSRQTLTIAPTYEGEIIAPVIQARTTDEGSPPHIIRPRKRGGKLVFYWPKVGRVVAFPYVNHPGNAPTHWWTNGLRKHWGDTLRRAATRTPL